LQHKQAQRHDFKFLSIKSTSMASGLLPEMQATKRLLNPGFCPFHGDVSWKECNLSYRILCVK